VVEKVQQDPHYPWFLTGDTAPLSLQSTVSGAAVTLYIVETDFGFNKVFSAVAEQFYGAYKAKNSTSVLKIFFEIPFFQELLESLLCFYILMTFSLKISNLWLLNKQNFKNNH